MTPKINKNQKPTTKTEPVAAPLVSAKRKAGEPGAEQQRDTKIRKVSESCVNATLQAKLLEYDVAIKSCPRYEGLVDMLPTSDSGVAPQSLYCPNVSTPTACIDRPRIVGCIYCPCMRVCIHTNV